MTVRELMKDIKSLVDSGEITLDTEVLLSDDEEGNGFHTPENVQRYNQKDIDDNCEKDKEVVVIW